jgi:hypothetical protein
MSDAEYERAVLWVPDPGSPAGWIRRKVWAEEPTRKKPPMGFARAAATRGDDSRSDDESRPAS